MPPRKKVAPVADDETTETTETTEPEPAADPCQPAEPCGHPAAFGKCWFSQIADPCGYACKWLIDQGEDAGR
jgi:hypothetical protein